MGTKGKNRKRSGCEKEKQKKNPECNGLNKFRVLHMVQLKRTTATATADAAAAASASYFCTENRTRKQTH